MALEKCLFPKQDSFLKLSPELHVAQGESPHVTGGWKKHSSNHDKIQTLLSFKKNRNKN